jgi:hypothetical protein
MWIKTAYDDLTAIDKLREAGAEMFSWGPEISRKFKDGMAGYYIEEGRKTDLGSEIIDSILAFKEQAQL